MSPAGRGVGALAQAVLEGERCLEPLKFNPRCVGGSADDNILARWRDFTPLDDRAVPLAAVAMDDALESAGTGAGGHALGRVGLALGTALGPIGELERKVARQAKDLDPRSFSFEVYAERLFSGSPCSTFSVTCVSGLCALEQAAADLALERADAMLVGGVDTLTSFMHGGFRALNALSPSGRLSPFSRRHDGILIGEAAAFAVLEPMIKARSRGAPIRGVVLAQRLVSDAYHLTSPDPAGNGMARAIHGVLEDAGLHPGDIGCITVTAAGSPVYDRMQSLAVHQALGKDLASRVPVTTWEGATGHLLAATGVLGLLYAALTMERGSILPALEVDEVDPECRLNYVLKQPVPLATPCVLALTVGFGGQNGVTLMASPEMAGDVCWKVEELAP